MRRNVSLRWEDPKLRWAEEVASSIRYLHRAQRFDNHTLSYTMGIVHRDIKTTNILIDAMFVSKITDFGESVDRADKEKLGIVGTPKFVAPEVMKGLNYGFKADVYSYGIVLSELATGKKPYHDFDGISLTREIMHGLRPTVPKKRISSALRSLMEHCWDANPKTRPTMDEVIEVLQHIDTTNFATEETVRVAEVEPEQQIESYSVGTDSREETTDALQAQPGTS